MGVEIFTKKSELYKRHILKILFKNPNLTDWEISKELKPISVTHYRTSNQHSIYKIIQRKGATLDQLTNQEFIQKIITKTANEPKCDRGGNRYSLTQNKGVYTALMLLNDKELSELLLSDFLQNELIPEIYLLTMSLGDKDNKDMANEINRYIRNSFNSLLSEYDLKGMSNDKFNNLVHMRWSEFMDDHLLSDKVVDEISKLCQDDRNMYLECLEDRAKNEQHLADEARDDQLKYYKRIDRINCCQEKIKKTFEKT